MQIMNDLANNCRSVVYRMWLKIGSVTSDFLSTVCVFVLFIYKLKFQGYESLFFLPSGFKFKLIHYV